MSEAEARIFRTLLLHGLSRIQAVQLKDNRSLLVSASRDGKTLYLQRSFAEAPPSVIVAIARFFQGRSKREQAAQARILRDWQSEYRSKNPLPHRKVSRTRLQQCAGTPDQKDFLRRLYRYLNRERARGQLPDDVRLTWSKRMRRRLGVFAAIPGREKEALSISLNIDLLIPGNEEQLLDTLLHEMAHLHTHLRYGEDVRPHGREWKRAAVELGCSPAATCRARIKRRRGKADHRVHAGDSDYWSFLDSERRAA